MPKYYVTHKVEGEPVEPTMYQHAELDARADAKQRSVEHGEARMYWGPENTWALKPKLDANRQPMYDEAGNIILEPNMDLRGLHEHEERWVDGQRAGIVRGYRRQR